MEIALAVVSVILILSIIISQVRHDYWVFKILEYPRLQKLILFIVVTGSWFFVWPLQKLFYQILLGLLFICILYLLKKILPYTRLSKKEMIRVESTDPKNEFRIFTANVLQDNKDFPKMLQQIRGCDPDLIFLLETDASWANALAELKNDYPYTLLQPLENTYGLLFYSRFKLKDAHVNFLVKDDIPSIKAILILPSGQEVQLWGLHPEPPVPGESMYSTAKDKELMKVALKVKECSLPTVVFGDLNDVAWSHTTELFRKTSEMLDPRRGRGFYSTFSAHNVLISFPLDYIFCSREFALIEMKRMPKNGSDHFAMFTRLAVRKDLSNVQDPPAADAEELQEAKTLAAQPVKE